MIKSSLTKSQINKLGKKLRECIKSGIKIDDADLYELQNYRTSFKEDIAPVFKTISEICKKGGEKNNIVSFRIKRIETILSKIERQPTMALGNMGDIAGCRVIVNSFSNILPLSLEIQKAFKVKSINDYTKNRKSDGYNGYHLYIESPIDFNKTIEIQIRTQQTHNWASLVEIIDILYNTKIKEGSEKEEDLKRFLILQSTPKSSLTIDNKKDIIDIDHRYGIYLKLNEIFSKNNVPIRLDWIDLRSKNTGNYFIIEVDENKKSKLISFDNYEEAEKTYFEMFVNNKTSNFVLAYIEKANFWRICTAYASYIMIKHNYLKDWSDFVHDVINSEKIRQEKRSFNLFREYISRNLIEQINLTETELTELNDYLNRNNTNNNLDAIKDWRNELKKRQHNLSIFYGKISRISPLKVRSKSIFDFITKFFIENSEVKN